MNRFSAKVELCRGALAGGAPLRLRILGTSMLPALWSGESVLVRPAELAELRLGDVAVFVRHGHFVAHRVVRRTVCPDGIEVVTRGDAQLRDDPPVEASEILGVVTAVQRFGVSRPLRRGQPLLARGVGWAVQRSPLVRSGLDRLNSMARDGGWFRRRPVCNPVAKMPNGVIPMRIASHKPTK